MSRFSTSAEEIVVSSWNVSGSMAPVMASQPPVTAC